MTYVIEAITITSILYVTVRFVSGLVGVWNHAHSNTQNRQEGVSVQEVVESVIEEGAPAHEAYTQVSRITDTILYLAAHEVSIPKLDDLYDWSELSGSTSIEWDEPAQKYGRNRVYRRLVARQQ